MSVLSDPKPSPPKASQRRKMAPVALAALMSLVLLGCPPTSPVGSLRFQGSVDDQVVYATGWPIAPLILPPASGGTGPVSYTLGPPIPGLTFDAQERTLSGTPAEAGRHHMTYTVNDSRKRTSANRYERHATVITSNRDFHEWPLVFANPLMASATMDRLMHRAVKIVIEGKSYRMDSFVRRSRELPQPSQDPQ